MLAQRFRRSLQALFPLFVLLLVAVSIARADGVNEQIGNGQTVTGTITSPNGLDTYTFPVQAGGSVFLSIAVVGATSNYEFLFKVYDPTGYIAGDISGHTYDYESLPNRTVGGTYTVTVGPNGSASSGVYKLTVFTFLGPFAQDSGNFGGVMSPGAIYSGSVYRGSLHAYTFDSTASSDDQVTLTVASSDDAWDPEIWVFGPDGSDYSGNFGKAGFTFSFKPYLAGTYSVIVGSESDGNDSTHPYSLSVSGPTVATVISAVAGKSDGACVPCQAAASQAMPVTITGQAGVGDPINVATGNLFEQVTDYSTAGTNPLALVRSYNSLSHTRNLYSTLMGANWRTNYDRYLRLPTASSVTAERPDGRVISFSLIGSTWTPDTDVDVTLTHSGSTWVLKDGDDTAETYTTSGSAALLNSIKVRNGYTQTLHYTGTQLTSLTDSYSRSLAFTYTGGNLTGVTTPDTLKLSYGYKAAAGQSVLTSVGYNTSPATSLTYLYENTSLPFALTGIEDEKGKRYATWAYDSSGRATSSEHAGGADLTQIAYDDSTGNRTVTGPLGLEEIYKFTTLQGIPKVTEIDRHNPAGKVPDAVMMLAYDSNGYLNTRVDWNGNTTSYTNNSHGLPTQIVEAKGSAVARTTTIAYDPTWVHLPKTIALGGLSTAYAYDPATGNLLTKTQTDLSASKGVYTSATRLWHYTWTATGQLLTVQKPRTDLTATTTYAYTGGTLTSVTNAAKQQTKITAYTPGGLPKTVVDPNGVTTTLTYDTRNHLKTSALTTSSGVRTTTYTYDAAENLISVQLPGTAKLTNTYDDAHRLKITADLLPQTINYTLDAAGDVTAMAIENTSGSATKSHARTFDAAGRMIADTGGASQKTQYSYDKNGNTVSIIDPLNHPATVQVFDALNRLSQTTDRAAGITKYTYDPYDRIATVLAPNGALTSYTYDGFGDLVKQVSPDTGTTAFYYDGDGSQTQKKDALNAIANYTYDALDRRLTATYPADTAENVTYIYDQTGHGDGIGRLTSMTDQAGTFSRSYDERGNITSESHTHGSYKLTTGYAYDPAGLLTATTYPDGLVVTQVRNTMERVTALSLKPSSTGAAQTVASGVTYEPFGPVTGFSYGNGIADARLYDGDYRATKVTDTGTSAIQNLTYALNLNDNVTGITDAVKSTNNQTLTYDALDRLKTASGSYGSQSLGYDASGNRNLYSGATWTYAPKTNRLTAIGSQTVATNADGSITGLSGSPATVFNYFSNGRLKNVQNGSSTVLSYIYDGFGRRVTGTDTAQRFYQYDQGGSLIEMTDNTDTVKLDYIYLNGLPVATFVPNGSAGTLSFLHTDRLGTPRRATTSAKAIGWSAEYQPFGAATITAATIANNLRLPGQEYELGSGFYHNGFREYVPGLGRYLESDPSGLRGGLNTYAYAGDNPLRFVDPNGEDFKSTARTVICGFLAFCAPSDPSTTSARIPSEPQTISQKTADFVSDLEAEDDPFEAVEELEENLKENCPLENLQTDTINNLSGYFNSAAQATQSFINNTDWEVLFEEGEDDLAPLL